MIDDIEYLKNNSETDAVIIYADSAKRNKQFFPDANHYEINLDQPLKFVYGLDVLDASIPNTMYNIDKYNNDFYLTTVTMPVANHIINSNTNITIEQVMFTELSACQSYINIYNNNENANVLVTNSNDFTQLNTALQLASSSNISMSNTNSFSSNEFTDNNYFLYYRNVLGNVNYSIQTNQTSNEYMFFQYQNINYAISLDQLNAINIINTGEYYLSSNNNIVYFTNNPIDYTTYIEVLGAGQYYINVCTNHLYCPIGIYSILSICTALSEVLANNNVSASATTNPPALEGKVSLTSTNYFIIDGNRGTLQQVLGMSTITSDASLNTLYSMIQVGSNCLNYSSLVDVSNPTFGFRLTPPGILNLYGERFLILKIQELEDHLYGSYAYGQFVPGIGLFKFASALGGVTSLRFDFVNFAKKPFHPIGKLTKLTIQFITSTGKLYDFKGIDHHIIFSFKYLVPSPKTKIMKQSILNPQYDPDLASYMANHQSIEYHEESDDEENFDSEQYRITYKNEFEKYDYESSTGYEDTEDDSEEDI